MNNITSFGEGELLPQEEKLEVFKQEKSLFIGVPKETALQENRISLVPEAVQLLVSYGHEVHVESGAGEMSNFSDNQFSEAGAKIVYSPKDVFQADIILKVVPPSLQELELMKGRQTIISALQITSRKKIYIQELMKKKINALAYEFIQDECGLMPLIRSI